MSIVIKRIGNRAYAYHAYRAGKKVVQKYLGPAAHPSVASRQARIKERCAVPARFHSLFWDAKPDEIGLKQHAGYVIERVLELGGLDAAFWLQRVYPTAVIVDILDASRKLSPRSRGFWKIWFGAGHAY